MKTPCHSSFLIFLFTILSAVSFLGCGDDQPEVVNDGRSLLIGQAVLPVQVSASRVGIANAPVQVVDFQRIVAGEIVGAGVTDADGNYAIEIPASRVVAVIVNGPFRISGLTTAVAADLLSRDVLTKDFNGVTDVACEAGVSALQDGSLSPSDMVPARIDNLELGSAVVNATTTIDFFNPASVTAAARLVRQITGNGAFPPS